jgi:hypothetical protein
MNDDGDLKRMFDEVRQDELRRTPSFERVHQGRSGIQRRPVPRRFALALGLAGLVAGLALTIWRSRSAAEESAAMVLAQQVSGWHSQTDFLLPSSGTGYLQDIPRIGEVTRWYPLDQRDSGTTPGRKENDSL